MMHRILSLGAAAAVLLFVGAVVAADKVADKDKTTTSDSAMTGTLSSVSADSITFTDSKGNDHKMTVDKDATATCDGKRCAVADLKKGVLVTVTTKKDDNTVATAIEAKSATAKDKDQTKDKEVKDK